MSQPAGGSEPKIRKLADEIYRERVCAAGKMSPQERLLAGEALFDYGCAITLAGIRNQFPEATEEQRLKILEERLALRERLEKAEGRLS